MSNDSTIRISVVSYLNSKPFIYGLKNGDFDRKVEITEDIPSVCAEKIKSGNADIGLVPVAILPELKNFQIISDYCIGADGKVGSVLLLSEVPLHEIKSILLDYQSRTSVMLARVLAKEHWMISPLWENATQNFEKNIHGNVAGVVIGDRALDMKDSFPFVYDLSDEWNKFTGLPFVFACWVSIHKLDDEFIKSFNQKLLIGLSQIADVAIKEKTEKLSEEKIKVYLTENIDYMLDDRKLSALDLFLRKARNIK